MKRPIFWAMGALGLLTAATGCTKTGSSYTTSAVTYLTVMNLAPSAPATTIYLNDALATNSSGIATGQFSSSYASLTPSNYDIKFKSPTTDSVYFDLPSSPFDTSTFYTVILYNNPGSTVAQAVKIQDNFSTVSSTFSNYRFFNMCPGYSSVDFYMNGVLVQGSRGTADNVSNSAYNSFQNVSAATYQLTVKKAGTDSTIATSTGVPLTAGNVYTIFFSGAAGSTSNPLSITALQAAY